MALPTNAGTFPATYLPAYRIEGQKEDENGAASPFLLLNASAMMWIGCITIIECMANVIGG
jgi:hypothetical protein